jgi:hypothetical protein
MNPKFKKLQNLYSWFTWAKTGSIENKPEMDKIQKEIQSIEREISEERIKKEPVKA